MRLPISRGVRRIDRLRLLAAGLAAWLGGAACAWAAPPASNEALIGELEALRRESVAVAHTAQQHERALAGLDHRVALLERDAVARQRGLDDSRAQQTDLLAALERLARTPPEALALAPEGPLDRLRAGMLMAAAIPALHSEAQALTTEIGRVVQLRAEIPQRRSEAAMQRQALARNHELLAHLAARRIEVTGKLVRSEATSEAKLRNLEHAGSLAELVKQADAEAARREKQHSANDPTRPKSLRELDPARQELLPPVAGTIERHFTTPDDSGVPGQRLVFQALPQGEVVAPFDGKVVYAASYREYGLVLIIRHGGLYHSVLAGLGRADVRLGEWIVAGEPVGVMPEAATNQPGVKLTFELRREDRAVDPEPSLAGTGDSSGGGSGRAE